MVTIDGHGAADGRLARWFPPRPPFQQAAHAEASGTRVFPLDIQHVLHEGQRELLGRVGRRAGASVLQPGEAVALEGLQDVPDMLTRQAQEARDTRPTPALVEEAHHRPARPIGVVELVEAGHRQGKLHRDRVPLQEGHDRVVVRFVPVLARDDARDFAVADRRVELAQIEDVARDDLGILMLPLRRGRPPIDQAEHAVLDETTRLLADGFVI